MIALQRILCPVDFSDCSKAALGYALAMGRCYEATVTALHAFVDTPQIEYTPSWPGQALALRSVDRDALWATLREFVHGVAGEQHVVTALSDGRDVREEIVRAADEGQTDLIVMGSHGRTGIERVVLGSVAEKVLRKAPCAVMLVPPAVAPPAAGVIPFKRILCAVDFSAGARQALGLALELAQEVDAQLTLVHAIEVPPELYELATATDVDIYKVRAAAEEACRQRLRASVPASAATYCSLDFQVAIGSAHREIVRAARESRADLIVTGAHGHGAVDRFVFGSTAHAVLCTAPCPVLAVRDGAQRPRISHATAEDGHDR